MRKNLFILFSITLIMGACATPSPDVDNTLPMVQPTEVPVKVEAEAPVTTIEANKPLPPASTRAVALNPPHGEPGHDCNVAVGSPLGGAGNSLNMPAPMPVMPSAVNPVSNPATGGVRLNPPHGEPGHDCNVQVGQPLS